MRRHAIPLLVNLSVVLVVPTGLLLGQDPQSNAAFAVLTTYQYDLEKDGKQFLLDEAKNNDFFMLGELHGEKEIPALLRLLWPEMWKDGYGHIAAEVSPWAAHQLESVPVGKGPAVHSLWTKQEVEDVRALANPDTEVLWGCDMDELQPQLLIQELRSLNPSNRNLNHMTALTADGYRRELAPALFNLAREITGIRDEVLNDISLRRNLLATLEIESNRFTPNTKMAAQNERELLMKRQLLEHLDRSAASGTHSKVLLRFGRNHLHRGYDERGISTLGNFVAELAIARGQRVFNVGAFAAGGKVTIGGKDLDADECQDEPAFALLAEKARYSSTIYDLRPLRPLLHRIPQEKRSPLQTNLTFWADAYDALICYKSVTPNSVALPK
jgi:hypothetical protein